MENVNITVRTYSSPSVANPLKPTVAPLPGPKLSGTEPTVGNASEGGGTSLGIHDKVPQDIDAAKVKESVEKLNAQLERSARSLRFQIDDTTKEIEVFVVDKETGEVVRKIPPEASIRLAANGELSGLFNIQG